MAVGASYSTRAADPRSLLKYSKHFNRLLCNCSKTFGFLRNYKY